MNDSKLLIIDDDPIIRQIIIEQLTESRKFTKNTFIEANDGKEGFQLLKLYTVDLIILDLDMPIMSGFEFLDKIKDHPIFFDIPIIVITGIEDKKKILKARRHGANGYFTKPFINNQMLFLEWYITEQWEVRQTDRQLIQTINENKVVKGSVKDTIFDSVRKLLEKIESHTHDLGHFASLREKDLQVQVLQLFDKVKDKDQFVDKLSAELQQTMQGIVKKIHIVINELIDENAKIPTVREQMQHILESPVQHILTLIDNTVKFSKIDDSSKSILFSAINLEKMSVDIVSSLKKIFLIDYYTKLPKNVNIEFDFEITNIYSDKKSVRQILTNLISNAMKFTNKGKILITSEDDNDFYRISVSDTGIGIAQGEQNKLFKEFTQLKGTEKDKQIIKGSGLGLSIVKKITNLLNGKVSVKSDLNEGSTFSVTLPKVPITTT
jgi:signal transduction histidine kinase